MNKLEQGLALPLTRDEEMGVFPPTPYPSFPWWPLNDMPLTNWTACWQGGAFGTWPGRVPSLRLPLHFSSPEPGSLTLSFLSSFSCFSLLALQISSCHFTHPAAFFPHLFFSPLLFLLFSSMPFPVFWLDSSDSHLFLFFILIFNSGIKPPLLSLLHQKVFSFLF